jgi:hypothetical protein
MSLKPWREIIVPHPDVLNGTFQQSEFAADLTAVRTGRATPEYGDAQAFYERTFITEGMGKLLIQVDEKFDGSKLGDANVQLDDTLLLIEPEAAKAYVAAHPPATPPGPTPPAPIPPGPTPPGPVPPGPTPPGPPPTSKPRSFHGNVAINASTAKMRMVEVAEEIIAVLAADPNAEVKVAVETRLDDGYCAPIFSSPEHRVSRIHGDSGLQDH